MNAALIDLHVRAPDETVSAEYLMDHASNKGLDGLVLIGQGQPPKFSEGETPKLTIYQGVELDTDVGRLLCLPSAVDEWFTSGDWSEPSEGAETLVAADVVKAFSERGGVVVVAQPFDRDLGHPCLESAFQQLEGLSGVVVTSSPKHTASNERAAKAALEAKLPRAGGSASGVTGDRFGSVATLFPRHPADQKALVTSVKAGRMWPVEVTALQSKNTQKAVANEGRGKRRQRKGKDDNRGNRLDLVKLQRPQKNAAKERQPEYDPIARLYGLHKRGDRRLQSKTDDELDRVNGNRSSGSDPNIMLSPDFRELQAERQHVNMLLQTIDGQRQQDRDSIALRFAVAALGRDANDEDIDFEALEAASIDTGRSRKRRRRRR